MLGIRKLIKLAFRTTTIVLAAYAAATIAWTHWAARTPPAPDYLKSIGSPDGRFKAVLAKWAGGGSISPYCYDRVSVVSDGKGDDTLVNEANVIFENDCRSFALRNGEIRNSPELSWRDGNVLIIKFATNPDVRRTVLRMPRLVASGEIAVEFKAAE